MKKDYNFFTENKCNFVFIGIRKQVSKSKFSLNIRGSGFIFKQKNNHYVISDKKFYQHISLYYSLTKYTTRKC